jgi:hypothetical protein
LALNVPKNQAMHVMRRERLAPAVLVGAAAAAAPALVEWSFGTTPVSIAPSVHFYAVGMTALGAAAASVALTAPDAILKKPGPLDDDEYEVVKRHAELGAKLIDELGGFPDSVRRLVRDHHERLDGTGYPASLSCE